MQLRELLQRGAALDWSSDSGYEGFNSIFRASADDAFLSLRDAQLSSEKAALAVNLSEGRDVHFVGSLLDRAIGEGFAKMADMLLQQHKDGKDEDGNTLLMHATVNGWDYLVKHLVYLDGVDISETNKFGESAIQLAVDRVRGPSARPLSVFLHDPPRCEFLHDRRCIRACPRERPAFTRRSGCRGSGSRSRTCTVRVQRHRRAPTRS